MPDLPVPAPANIDARNRATRTFVQGLAAAVVLAIIPVVMAAIGELRLTRTWLIGLGVLVGQAALAAVASYVARYTHPPSTS